MSYHSDINDTAGGLSDNYIKVKTLFKFLDRLGIQPKDSYRDATDNVNFQNNFVVKINDKDYEICNTTAAGFKENLSYNLHDAIAVAKVAGCSDDSIANALQYVGYGPPKWAEEWNAQTVAQYQLKTTNTAATVQKYLDAHYSDINARVEVRMNPQGTDYLYYVTYDDDLIGGTVTQLLSDTWDTSISVADITNTLSSGNSPAGALNAASNIRAKNNANAAAERSAADAQTVIDSLTGENSTVGTSANAFQSLSEQDKLDLTAALPTTDNLTAYNKGKDTNIFGTVIKNLQQTNPKLLERMSLEDLQGVADIVNESQLSTTQRDIKSKQSGLLKAIAQDPELYNKITQQARADNAAGTIVGQRAANAQAIAAEADAGYDKQASELYASLFGGEQGNVAQQTYANALTGKTSALDQFITGKLNDAVTTEKLNANAIQELGSLLGSYGEMLGVDLRKYVNESAENQTTADGKYTDKSSTLASNLEKELADNDAALQYIVDNYSTMRDYFQAGAAGSDVSAALDTLINTIGKGVTQHGYKQNEIPDYQKAEQLDNKAYNDLINSGVLDTLLQSGEGSLMDNLTKALSIEEYMAQAGLGDALTKAGMQALYDQYNKEATEQANSVFNKAQRAYIAAITAGDAKTAEQLTKLAGNAGASKGNLYAASALANQFKQQMNNNGNTLATDFLNQKAFNDSAAAQARINADAAQNKYLGNGSDTYDSGTLYGAYNQHSKNAADMFDSYTKLGNTFMNTTQGLNDERVKANIQNYDRLSQFIMDLNKSNVASAANNQKNQATKQSTLDAAMAQKAQAESILSK